MDPVELLAYLATGFAAGVMAGLMGVGGGILVVPALAFIFAHAGFTADWSFHLAVGTSLATLVGTGSASAYSHHRRGAVRWDLVRTLAPWLVVGAWLGSKVAGVLDGTWLRAIFGVFLAYVSLGMLVERARSKTHALPGAAGMGLAGLGIGGVSAMVGIAGGTLTVPFLARGGLDMRQAVATSAACGPPIALMAMAGFLHDGWGREGLPAGSTGFVYWPAVAAILVASVPAAPLGARLAHSLPLPLLKRIFGVLLLSVAVALLAGVIRS